jgi:hypothetical protein
MDKNSKFSDQIKESFEEIFQQNVPQNFWTELSSALEEEGLLSENEGLLPSEKEQIQSSFETTHQAEAPSFVWDNVSEAIETEGLFDEAMDDIPETEAFGEIIKSSFISNEKTTAPVNIWSKIEGEIYSPSSEDQIKESFEQSYTRKAPDYVWNAVRHQINIDQVWDRLSAFLDRMRYRQMWKQRIRRWSSYAAILVFMHACLPIVEFGNSKTTPHQLDPSEGPFAQQEIFEENNNSEPKTEEKTNHNFTPFTQFKASTSFGQKLPSQQLAQSNDFSNLGKSEEAAEHNVFTKPNFAESIKEQSKWKLGLPIVKGEERTSLAEIEEPNISDVEQNSLIAEAKTEELNTPKNNKSALEDLAIQWLNPAAFELIEREELNIFPDLSTYPEQKSSKSSKKSFNTEVGFISAVGTSILLNEETFQSWEENTLLVNDLSQLTHIGLLVVQPIDEKSALAVEVSGFHRICQTYDFFSNDGYYKSKRKELNYARLTASYQRSFYNYKLFGLQTDILSRTGLYLAYLTEERAILNDVTDNSSTFNKYDLGLNLMLGQTHAWDNFVFEYGGQFNMGMLNVFNGQSLGTNISIDQTHIISTAAYLSLRYRF